MRKTKTDDTCSMDLDVQVEDKSNSLVIINVPSREKQIKQSSEEKKSNEN